MVGSWYFVINFCLVWFEIVRAENVVYTHIHSAFMVRYSRTVSTCYISVGQMVGNGFVGVANRIVVEIATQYYRYFLV